MTKDNINQGRKDLTGVLKTFETAKLKKVERIPDRDNEECVTYLVPVDGFQIRLYRYKEGNYESFQLDFLKERYSKECFFSFDEEYHKDGKYAKFLKDIYLTIEKRYAKSEEEEKEKQKTRKTKEEERDLRKLQKLLKK